MVMSKVQIRIMARIGIALAISCFLILQSFLVPISQARAANASALDAILNVICTTDGDHANGSGDQQKPAHCELPCCLPSHRADFKIDVPIVEPTIVLAPPLDEVAKAPSYPNQVELLPDDLVLSRQHRARAPPAFS